MHISNTIILTKDSLFNTLRRHMSYVSVLEIAMRWLFGNLIHSRSRPHRDQITTIGFISSFVFVNYMYTMTCEQNVTT